MKPEQFEMQDIVKDLPAGSQKDRAERDIELFLAAFDQYGPLVLRADAARILGVTQQAVADLVSRGQLTCILGLPRPMIPFAEVIARRARAPRAGRPRKQAA